MSKAKITFTALKVLLGWVSAGLLFWGCLDSDRLSTRPVTKKPSSQASTTTTTTIEQRSTSTPSEAASSTTRPDDAISINSNFCSCLNRKADSINNCDSFCSSRAVENATLFGSVTPGASVLADARMRNLEGWCTSVLNTVNVNPTCRLEVYSDDGTRYLELVIAGNSFQANISSLNQEQTYIMTIVEEGSGARTGSFQLRRTQEINTVDLGPLKVSPINEYACINRTAEIDQTNAQDMTFLNAIKRHFYYTSSQEPPTRPPGDVTFFCHDIIRYGDVDNASFDRLDLREQTFFLWGTTDSRFFDIVGPNGDNNPDEQLDINNYITDQMLSRFQITYSNPDLFVRLSGFTSPTLSASDATSSDSTVTGVLGYYLRPQIHPTTREVFCPDRDDYKSNIPLLNVLGELIGVPTEALYLAKSESQSITNADGTTSILPEDIIYVRESVVKRIWFYYDNGIPKTPDSNAIRNKRLHFYWQPDFNFPHIKKPSQLTYSIIYPGETSSAAGGNSFITFTPPDKRFACVPKQDSQ